MNVYDSTRMADLLAPHGYETTDKPDNADVVLLNTCHIREKAAEKTYSDLGRIRAHKNKRKALGEKMVIGVAGCVAQAEGAEIMKRAPYVDMVFGPQTYHRLPEMVTRAVRASGQAHLLDTDFPVESKFDFLPNESQTLKGAMAFVSVQEGCDKFCTFCVVPYTRGAEYSRPVQKILDEVKALTQQGVKEIHLLGQNVNAYHGVGSDGKEWSLARLIYAIADMDGVERIRYTTSHPRDMTDALIQAHGDVPALMPYLHLPIQSGSDRVLDLMNRQHKRDLYFDIMDRLRAVRPDIALSSDFIVGFPGESDKDFDDTLDLVRRVKYAQAYSFKYSPRPGTPAAAQELQVDEKVKVARLAALQDLLNQQQVAFNEATTGKVLPVLFERKSKHDGQLWGRTPYMQTINVAAPLRLIDQIVDVEITAGFPNSLSGKVVTDVTTTSTAA